MNARFVLGRGNVLCVAGVVNRSLKADCTDLDLIFFLTDLNSIHNNLSSDYSLNICFSRRFPYTDGPFLKGR